MRTGLAVGTKLFDDIQWQRSRAAHQTLQGILQNLHLFEVSVRVVFGKPLMRNEGSVPHAAVEKRPHRQGPGTTEESRPN